MFHTYQALTWVSFAFVLVVLMALAAVLVVSKNVIPSNIASPLWILFALLVAAELMIICIIPSVAKEFSRI